MHRRVLVAGSSGGIGAGLARQPFNRRNAGVNHAAARRAAALGRLGYAVLTFF